MAVLASLLAPQLAGAQPDRRPPAGGAPTAAASAEPTARPVEDGGLPEAQSDGATAEPVDEELARLEKLATDIRALLAGTLDAGVDPATLFDQKLDDGPAIAIEAARLQLIVGAADRCIATQRRDAAADAAPPLLGQCDELARARRAAHALLKLDAGQVDAAISDAGAPAPTLDDVEPNEQRLAARLDVDRARLEFYELPATKRSALLDQHAERQKSDTEAKSEQELSEAERKAQEAAEEREKAVEAARKARTEAARIVADEKVRLLGLKKRHAEVEGEIIRREQTLRDRQESILGWRRKVAAIVSVKRETGRSDTGAADQLRGKVYEELTSVRAALQVALAELEGDQSSVPATGANPLEGIAVEVDRQGVDELRAEIEKEERALKTREAKLRWGRAATLMGEVEALSNHRLTLLPHLSSDRRDAVTGFGPEGRAVARAEAMQVWLVLRYHLLVTQRFASEVRTLDAQHSDSALTATWTALKWMLPVGVFFWWRRRAPRWLERWRDRANEEARSRRRSGSGIPAVKVASFLLRVRTPLEWLVLVWAVLALLPAGVRSLLEIELLWTIALWSLSGLLIVDIIDALFASGEHPRRSALQTAHLRLRSLRWIGRAVVGFGLVLALTAKLVGQGAIYGWVWSTCWWAAVPIGLAIVKWWRPVIFERIALLRRKGAVATWVEGQANSWRNYPAAVVGGTYLLGWGVARRARSFVGRFDTTRRALAYLFRREMAKQAERRAEAGVVEQQYDPLDADKHAALSPAKPSTDLVPSVADKQVDDVINRVVQPGGGVFALVGERGGGKSTLLGRIRDRTDDTTLVRCPPAGVEAFHQELRGALALTSNSSSEQVRAKLDKRGGDNALLIDDAHRLIRPVIGGLADIDRLLELARVSSSSCTWVFAFDAVIWQYFERARDTGTLFDDVIALRPWSEEGIVRLLESRSVRADVDARFDDLLSELPENADDIDREEASDRTRSNFYRLLWDYARGNPGVALHFWRISLRRHHDGSEVVRMFTTPSTSALEGLPESAVFVLRTIIQLEWATVADIGAATMVESSLVHNAVRYGLARGYLEREDDRYRVRWDWFRAITVFLERRHLLVGKGE